MYQGTVTFMASGTFRFHSESPRINSLNYFISVDTKRDRYEVGARTFLLIKYYIDGATKYDNFFIYNWTSILKRALLFQTI